jgi:hypothetical protein
MAKRRGQGRGVVSGVPMREVLEFLCSGVFDREDEPAPEHDRIDFFVEFGFRERKAAIEAKGWLVEGKSKQPKARMRYRVTEAGKLLGRESAPTPRASWALVGDCFRESSCKAARTSATFQPCSSSGRATGAYSV